MRVLIDGVEFSPAIKASELADNKEKALASPMECMDFENITVKDYLFNLLDTLWDRKESFGGKRPFGNSGWEYDLIHSLIESEYIPGTKTKDKWGLTEYCYDETHANLLIKDLIKYVFYKVDR